MTRQLVHGGDVAGAAREADHVSAAAVEAVTRLQRRHHAERVEHLPGGRGHRAGPDLAKRRLVDVAVLPDLELREVEAERLSLPDKVLDLTWQQGRANPDIICLGVRIGADFLHWSQASGGPAAFLYWATRRQNGKG